MKYVLQEKIIRQRKIITAVNYFFLTVLNIPDASAREMWKYRFIKSTGGKYNAMGYLTEAEKISQTVSDQSLNSR